MTTGRKEKALSDSLHLGLLHSWNIYCIIIVEMDTERCEETPDMFDGLLERESEKISLPESKAALNNVTDLVRKRTRVKSPVNKAPRPRLVG